MTSGRLIARNALVNLAGQLVPVLIAVAAMPILVHRMHPDRFGLLALAWSAIGYFALLDLGLGRALTHAVAMRASGDSADDVLSPLVWTTLAAMLGASVLGAIACVMATPWVVVTVLAVPGELRGEAIAAFRLLAWTLPLVVTTAGLRGLLEAHQRFGIVTALRLPLSMLTYLGPLAVLPFTSRLFPIVAVLVAGRVIAWFAHLVVCLRAYPSLRRVQIARNRLLPLLRMGGWMTVSNVVSPLMVYVDRFVIGAMLPIAAVAYYVTPYEVVTKLWLVPAALLGVLFPAFAASSSVDVSATARLAGRGMRVLLLTLFPVVAITVPMAPELLALWLGSEFARQSAVVLQWLAIGVFVNCIGFVPHTVLQGVGRPDLTAKVHLIEVLPYLVLLWLMVGRLGIAGAAIAWTVRVSVDAAVLFALARRHVGAGAASGPVLATLAGAVAVLAGMTAITDIRARMLVALGAASLTILVGVVRLVEPVERAAVLALIGGRWRAPANRS